MAMMFQAHLMLLFLLSLFFLSTSQSIPFHNCGLESDPVNVTGVEKYQAQDGESFKIIGSTKELITGGDIHVIVKLSIATIVTKDYDLCELMACPIASGAAFVLPFPKFFPALPGLTYKIRVMVTDEPGEDMLCVRFDFHTSSLI